MSTKHNVHCVLLKYTHFYTETRFPYFIREQKVSEILPGKTDFFNKDYSGIVYRGLKTCNTICVKSKGYRPPPGTKLIAQS